MLRMRKLIPIMEKSVNAMELEAVVSGRGADEGSTYRESTIIISLSTGFSKE